MSRDSTIRCGSESDKAVSGFENADAADESSRVRRPKTRTEESSQVKGTK
jgi:hypothetical protein